ncbi:MAG: hypothetical protein JXR76_19750 [Deltaproteobacteria bacterium]|nr:hypothetical protein [Deltaproteobacteria bacterium]
MSNILHNIFLFERMNEEGNSRDFCYLFNTFSVLVFLAPPRERVPKRIPEVIAKSRTWPHIVPEQRGTRAAKRTIGKSASFTMVSIPSVNFLLMGAMWDKLPHGLPRVKFAYFLNVKWVLRKEKNYTGA